MDMQQEEMNAKYWKHRRMKDQCSYCAAIIEELKLLLSPLPLRQRNRRP